MPADGPQPAAPASPERGLDRLPLLGRPDEVGQFARTVAVGGANTALSHAVLTLCQFVLFVGLPEAWRTDASVTATFLLVVAVSFGLNRRWSFRLGSARGSGAEFARFVAANGLSLLVPIAGWTLVEAVFGQLDVLWFNATNFAMHLAVLPLKYLLYRSFVFRRALRAAGRDA